MRALSRVGERRDVSKRMLYRGDRCRRRRAPSPLRALSRLSPARGRTNPASMRSWPARKAPGSPAIWSRRHWRTPSPRWCRSTWQRCATASSNCSTRPRRRSRTGSQRRSVTGIIRAEELKDQEQAGKANARLNSGEARKRADDLQARLQKRMEEIELEAQISPLPPVVLGGLLVVPAGLIAAMTGRPLPIDANRGRHSGGRRARAGDRHGDRARARLRADRPRIREARLRHRKPRSPAPAGCVSWK